MSKVKYPAYIHTDNGSAILFQGHNLDPFDVEAEVEQSLGPWPQRELHVTEVHWSYMPRVKHCSNYGDGWGCDEEGEWHSHWFGVRPSDNPEIQFTLAEYVWVSPEAAE